MSKLKAPKVLNPEARLQASVARDLKLRHLEEHARHQAEALSAAKWEVSFSEKEEKANRKRLESQIMDDSKVAKINNTITRKQALEALYLDDELRYEYELRSKGLAFRRDRL